MAGATETPRRSDDRGGRSISDPSAFEVWKEYEQIAMHFNELLIQLRGRALAAVAGLAALGGFLAQTGEADGFRWGIVTAVFAILLLGWAAIFALDLFYYDRLLRGAVDALLDLENGMKEGTTTYRPDISTKIERAVRGESPNRSNRLWLHGRTQFYAFVASALLIGLVLSGRQYFVSGDEAPAQEQEAPGCVEGTDVCDDELGATKPGDAAD